MDWLHFAWSYWLPSRKPLHVCPAWYPAWDPSFLLQAEALSTELHLVGFPPAFSYKLSYKYPP